MAKEMNNKPNKVKEPRSESKVMQILKTEYKFENWLLAILSPILLIWGVYIILGRFGTFNLAAILGTSGVGVIDFFFNTALKRILTGSFLVLIGLLVIVYLLIPYIRPSVSEMKKVSWPTAKVLALNSSRVFTFLIFLMLVFYLYSAVLNPFFRAIYGN